MASRFWVGGTGSWDAVTTTHWATASNGAGGASVPGSGDDVTLDANSGGGTVTVATTLAIASLTISNFNGTFDANNNDITISGSGGFANSSSIVRTLTMGSGTWTLSFPVGAGGVLNLWNQNGVANLTLNPGTSTIVFSGAGLGIAQLLGGGKTYANLTVNGNSNRGGLSIAGANTFANVTIGAPNTLALQAGATHTITGTLTATGTASSPIGLIPSTGTGLATISKASGTPTLNYAALRGITFAGGATWAATNSIDLGMNSSNITITAPSAGAAGMLENSGMVGGMNG